MAERFDKNRISDIQGRNIFLDANVLIYLNWSMAGSEQYEIDYSSVYQLLSAYSILMLHLMCYNLL